MNAQQKAKRRVYARLGRGHLVSSWRWLNDGRTVRGKLKQTGVRARVHVGVGPGTAWRLGSYA